MSDDVTPEELKRIDAALRSMRSLTRNIYLVAAIDKMSYDEIAERTGLTREQVVKHLVRAVCQLDRALCGVPTPWWRRLF